MDAKPYTASDCEEWRPTHVSGYEVSSAGRVRSWRGGRNGYVLKPSVTIYGYEIVRLAHATFTVHRLVAAAFIGPRPDGYHINHIDGDKRNNALANLEYCTPKENQQHASRLGLTARGPSNSRARLTAEQVLAIRSVGRDVTYAELAATYGITVDGIYAIRHGKTWRHVDRSVSYPRERGRGRRA